MKEGNYNKKTVWKGSKERRKNGVEGKNGIIFRLGSLENIGIEIDSQKYQNVYNVNPCLIVDIALLILIDQDRNQLLSCS
jgi:hypothetical protein